MNYKSVNFCDLADDLVHPDQQPLIALRHLLLMMVSKLFHIVNRCCWFPYKRRYINVQTFNPF